MEEGKEKGEANASPCSVAEARFERTTFGL